MIRRAISILLILWFAALGAGVLEYLHNLQHEAEDAKIDAAAQAAGKPIEHHEHDDSNCETHAQLHMALFLSGWVPLLVRLGIFLAILSLLARPLIHRLFPVRINCRGPPLA